MSVYAVSPIAAYQTPTHPVANTATMAEQPPDYGGNGNWSWPYESQDSTAAPRTGSMIDKTA